MTGFDWRAAIPRREHEFNIGAEKAVCYHVYGVSYPWLASLRDDALRPALRDLEEVCEEAEEEGYPLPTKETVDIARRALYRIHHACNRLVLGAYPTPDGSVMVQGWTRVDGEKHTIMIECMPDGTADCSYFAPHERSRQTLYDSADVMLNHCGLLPSVLREIRQQSENPWTKSHEPTYKSTAWKTAISSEAVSRVSERLGEQLSEASSIIMRSYLLERTGGKRRIFPPTSSHEGISAMSPSARKLPQGLFGDGDRCPWGGQGDTGER